MFKSFYLSIFFSCLTIGTLSAQIEIPFNLKKVHITQFDAPYTMLQTDITDATLALDKVSVTEETQFINRKKKAVNKEDILAGMKISIEGVIKKGKKYARTIQVHTDVGNWEVKLEGVLEAWDGEIALLDGSRVKMSEKVEISGFHERSAHGDYSATGFDHKAWKKMKAKHMDEEMVGMFAKIEGSRKKDGFVYAEKVKICPNYLAKKDAILKELVEATVNFEGITNVAPTAIVSKNFPSVANKLSGGMLGIGGMRLKLIEDLEVQAYANYVGERVIPEVQKALEDDDATKIDFRFYVIEHPAFNAFAFPNGMIFIHSGLMKMIENEAQLAAILGHEITHVTHEHSRIHYKEPSLIGEKTKDFMIKRLAKTLGISPELAKATKDFDSVYTGFSQAKESQDDENQADRVGLIYMKEAGYDPREATKIWQHISEATNDNAFMEDIMNRTKAFLNSPQSWDSAFDKDNVKVAVEKSILPSLFESMYASHPKAIERYQNLNFVIATNFSQDKLSELEVGKEYFKQVVDRLGAR